MLKVNESRRNQKRYKHPIRQGERKPIRFPNPPKQNARQQLNEEIPKSNRLPAGGATPAQGEPTHERQILIPWDGFFAGGTKRATRLSETQAQWHAVNAGIQKRPHHRSQHGCENRQKQTHSLSRLGSTISHIV